jgi:16S rRNA processing protein RimM
VALVVVGKVVRAVGLKGLLGVAGTEGALPGVDEITLRRGAGEVEVRKVLEARPQGRVWAVQIEGVSDRTAAEAWVGAEVLVERGALGEAEDGTFFWADLEGLPVVTASGEAVGKVTGFYATGAADVLVVTGERGERLVPLAPYVEVDLEARRIVVDPPDGLLD